MTLKTLTLTAALLAIPAAGFAQFNLGDTVGTTEADVRAAVEARGYAVSEIEIEDDEIEVEYTVDGVAFEMTMSLATGAVLEIEQDDEDEGDD